LEQRVAEPFIQLDIRAPRIGDERERNLQRWDNAVRHVDPDALRFQPLAEFLEVPDLEASVIERAAARRDYRPGRLRKMSPPPGKPAPMIPLI
jgi:hypothetical protein